MNDYVAQLSIAAKDFENRPVWEKLGELQPRGPSEPDIMYSPTDDKPDKSVLWITTNSEYGRFQNRKTNQNDQSAAFPYFPNDDGINRSMDPELRGSRCGSDAGYRADEDEAVRLPSALRESRDGAAGDEEESHTNQYMPIQGTSDDSGSVVQVPDHERRKLTTGYAKSYMRQSCAPMWNNMQTIADGAGFITSGGAANGRPDTQILKVDNEGENSYADVDDVDAFLAKLRSEEQ